MFNTAEIFRTAHAAAKAEVRNHGYIRYRAAFARALRYAWDAAKRAVAEAARPVADRIRNLEMRIISEENRDRGYDFALISRLRRQVAELQAAA